MKRVKSTVVPEKKGTLRLGEWLQQIPGITFEISVQKTTILRNAKILCRTFRLPHLILMLMVAHETLQIFG